MFRSTAERTASLERARHNHAAAPDLERSDLVGFPGARERRYRRPALPSNCVSPPTDSEGRCHITTPWSVDS